MPHRTFPQNEYLPQGLSFSELQTPALVIDELFQYAHLPEIRDVMWQWLDATVTGNFNLLPWQDKGSITYLFRLLVRVIEAVAVMHKHAVVPNGSNSSANSSGSRPVISNANDTLLQVIEKIQAQLHIQQVYLVHKTENQGQLPQYYLLVLVPTDTAMSVTQYQKAIARLCAAIAQVQALVLKMDAAQADANKGNVWLWYVCRAEKLLYNADSHFQVKFCYSTLWEAMEQVQDAFKYEMRRADAFWDGARFQYQLGNAAIAAYMLHQSVAHMCKGVITSFSQTGREAASLTKQLQQAAIFLPGIQHTMPTHTPDHQSVLQLLQDAQIEFNYRIYAITRPQLDCLLSSVEQLHKKARDMFAAQCNEIQQALVNEQPVAIAA